MVWPNISHYNLISEKNGVQRVPSVIVRNFSSDVCVRFTENTKIVFFLQTFEWNSLLLIRWIIVIKRENIPPIELLVTKPRLVEIK